MNLLYDLGSALWWTFTGACALFGLCITPFLVAHLWRNR